MSSRTFYAQNPVSLRIFSSLPGSRLRFFIAGQIQHPTVHSFLYTPAQIDAPCRVEINYVRNIKLKKCVIVLNSTGLLSRMYSSSTFYAQNPALEIVDQQEEHECLSTHACRKRMFSRTNPLCAASYVTKNISPRFSSTIFYRDAISVLLRAHLCTAVDSMRRKPCVRKCLSREREGLYNGQGQRAQFHLSVEP